MAHTYHGYRSPAGRASLETLLPVRREILLDQVLATMIEAVPDYVLVLNEQRQILAMNKRLLQTFGIEEVEALIGQRPGELLGCLFSADGEEGCGTGSHCATCGAITSIQECQRLDVQSAHECRLSLNQRDGGQLDLLVVSTPLVINEIRLIFCVLKDISADKWRGVLERVFFHDVMNTAGGIHGLASLLEQGKLGDASREASYKKWLVELSHQLIDEIAHQRKLLSAEKGTFIPDLGLIKVADLLQEVHALYGHHDIAAEIELRLGEIADCTIVSDGTILRRILGNLVKNALEATPVGGSVTLGATRTPSSVTFTVHNGGVMSREVQLQLFQRSFSTKSASGRGIGTYSAKLFAERYLQGKLSFVSREGEGTLFTLTLPVITIGEPKE